jgi:chromate transporter
VSIKQETTTDSAWAIFLIFLRLGLTSFGGPIAHISYFRSEFVMRRAWLSERGFADLVALCQFLPGPSSSQLGIALGLSRAGARGAAAAWLGFTLPSALALALLARGMAAWGQAAPAGALHGLKIVAVAVVAQAVWGMARSLCADAPRFGIAAIAAILALSWPAAAGQIAILAAAALLGSAWLKSADDGAGAPLPIAVRRRSGALLLGLFFALLIGLPLAAGLWPSLPLSLINAFYRAGALVFGGGHVVLPLLQAAVVPPGWVNNETFLAGYGLAQAVPGPLFTFAAFLGAAISGWPGAAICLLAIFGPSFLLVAGVLPFWESWRHQRRARAALAGVNAAVVGLLFAAWCHPVWTSAIFQLSDFGLALLALLALMRWKLPPWLVVAAGAGAAWLSSLSF